MLRIGKKAELEQFPKRRCGKEDPPEEGVDSSKEPLRAWLHMRQEKGAGWTSQALTDTLSLFRHSFKRVWTYTAQMAVSTGAIVEGLDVIVDLGLGDLTGLVDSLLNPLLLQAAKK